MKYLTVIGIIFVLLCAAYFVLASKTDTFTGRWVAWKSSDVGDYYRFPNITIDNAPPTFYFKEDLRPSFEEITYSYKGNSRTLDLNTLLESTGTLAFLVIKDDTILYEDYFNGNQRDSIVTSFSIAKSVTSLLIGRAIDDGYIEGLDDPVTEYIPELLETDPAYQHITLGHLLSMKSGIAFKDTDIPWHDKSRAYYHPNLREVVTNLPISNAPGEEFVYNTFNPIILGIVIERATGQSVVQYFETSFWQQLGMEYDASWSIDSEADSMAKMESGLNARAIDFAKIGRLVLHRGNWNGNQVVSESWIEDSTKIDPNNLVSKFGDNLYYQNGWWIVGPSDSDRYTIEGWGHLGQYLYIFPEENMLVLRFGTELGKVDSWHQIAQEIVSLVTTGE
jgi:CubicO group peptidase (beta-lactamase class C family)